MSFFVAPNEDFLDLATEDMRKDPAQQDAYQAIAELRDADRQGLTISPAEAARANGFFRVASVQGSLNTLAKLLDPDFMKDPKRFYKWLDKHKQHATYDRRQEKLSSKQMTFVDGKAVV